MGAVWRRLVVLTALVVACGGSLDPSGGSVATKAEVEELLSRRTAALAKGDLSGFQSTYDSTRLAFRRWQTEEFEDAKRGYVPYDVLRVLRIEPYRDEYLRAHVEINPEPVFGVVSASHVVRYYLRRVEGRLVLTEPRQDELGAERSEQVAEHLSVSFWGIDEELGELLVAEAKHAQGQVVKYAPAGFSENVTLRLYPTAEVLGPGWTYINLSTFGRDRVIRFAPIVIGLDTSMRELSEASRSSVQLELARALRQQIVPGIAARLISDAWLESGWIHYVAGIASADFFKPVCGGVAPPSLREVSARVSIIIPGTDYARAYAYQRSLIEYLYERFGPQAYWDLLAAFQAEADSRIALPKVLALTPDRYYSDWLAWARRKYC